MYRSEYDTSQLYNFNHFLKVESDLTQSPSKELPATIIFTISNTASAEPNYAEVFFDEVKFRYGIPPNLSEKIHNNLSAGEFFAIDFNCRYRDLPEIHFEVEGKISAEKFFSTNSIIGTLTQVTNRLTSLAYLQVFNEIKIHHWFDDLIKIFPVPNTNTSLAELKKQDDLIKTIIQEISVIEKYMDDYTRFSHIESKEIEKYRAFKNNLQSYLRDTIKELAQLQKALGAPNSREFQNFESIRDSMASRLSISGSKLNHATEEFMQACNISDEDGHYTYREWGN